jgi:RNA polymerase sigma-70 factor (ECF subfamily)
MWLHAARLPARLDDAGELLGFAEQDRARWDRRLTAEGLARFEAAASGETLSAYHLEAAIAVVHAGAARFEDTDWGAIVALYDRLLALAPSPMIALSRAVAVGERDGPARGLAALRGVAGDPRLARHPSLPAALGDFELRRGDRAAAAGHFRAALALARNDAERRFLMRRLGRCEHIP